MPSKRNTTDLNQSRTTQPSLVVTQPRGSETNKTNKSNKSSLPQTSSSSIPSTGTHDESQPSSNASKKTKDDKNAAPVSSKDAFDKTSKSLDPELVQSFSASYLALCKGIDMIQPTFLEHPDQKPSTGESQSCPKLERLERELRDLLFEAQRIDPASFEVHQDYLEAIELFHPIVDTPGPWNAGKCNLDTKSAIQFFMTTAPELMRRLLDELRRPHPQWLKRIAKARARVITQDGTTTSDNDPVERLVRSTLVPLLRYFFHAPIISPGREVGLWLRIVNQRYKEFSTFQRQLQICRVNMGQHKEAFSLVKKHNKELSENIESILAYNTRFHDDLFNEDNKEYFKSWKASLKDCQTPDVISSHLKRLTQLGKHLEGQGIVYEPKAFVQTVKEISKLATRLVNQTASTLHKAIETHQAVQSRNPDHGYRFF